MSYRTIARYSTYDTHTGTSNKRTYATENNQGLIDKSVSRRAALSITMPCRGKTVPMPGADLSAKRVAVVGAGQWSPEVEDLVTGTNTASHYRGRTTPLVVKTRHRADEPSQTEIDEADVFARETEGLLV